MSLGSGGGKTVNTTSNEPPAWAAPLLTQSATAARNLYNSNTGFNIYPDSTVADQSANTQAGIGGLAGAASGTTAQALENNPANLTNTVLTSNGLAPSASTALTQLGNIAGGAQTPQTTQANTLLSNVGNAPLSSQQQSALGIFNAIGSGANSINTGTGYANVGTAAAAPGAAEQYYTNMASGQTLAEGNPYFRQLLEKGAGEIGDQVNAMFSSAGRYGSGANQDMLADSIGDYLLKGYGQDFDRERAYQQQAIQGLEDAQNQSLAQRLQALQGQTGVQQQNIANQFGAASQIGNVGQQGILNALNAAQGLGAQGQSQTANQMAAAQAGAGIGNQGYQTALGYIGALPTVQENRIFDSNLLLQSGAMQDQYNQALLNDQISQFYAQDMQPWIRLGALQAAAQGAAGPYGQGYSSTKSPSQPFNPMSLVGLLPALMMA